MTTTTPRLTPTRPPASRSSRAVANSWEKYASLTSSPSADIAVYAARAYTQLSDWAGAASAWETYALATPTQAKGFQCLAYAAYAAKQTRKAGLAAAKALALAPKVDRLVLKESFTAAKTSSAYAQEC